MEVLKTRSARMLGFRTFSVTKCLKNSTHSIPRTFARFLHTVKSPKTFTSFHADSWFQGCVLEHCVPGPCVICCTCAQDRTSPKMVDRTTARGRRQIQKRQEYQCVALPALLVAWSRSQNCVDFCKNLSRSSLSRSSSSDLSIAEPPVRVTGASPSIV